MKMVIVIYSNPLYVIPYIIFLHSYPNMSDLNCFSINQSIFNTPHLILLSIDDDATSTHLEILPFWILLPFPVLLLLMILSKTSIAVFPYFSNSICVSVTGKITTTRTRLYIAEWIWWNV